MVLAPHWSILSLRRRKGKGKELEGSEAESRVEESLLVKAPVRKVFGRSA